MLLTEGEEESDDVFAFFIDEDRRRRNSGSVEDEAEFALIEAEYDRIMDRKNTKILRKTKMKGEVE